MKRKLPPLASLATAAAIAQERTFTAAAEKLHVTPSAISHQIRGLEDWLGFALFRRDVRSVRITEEGAAYLEKVSVILNNLESVTLEAMEQAGKRKLLRIQTTDSLASRWLVSLLPSFQAKHPNLSVSIVTREYTEGYRSTDADIAILYGRGDWPNFVCNLILREAILPVCSPELLRGDPLETLRGNRLLHDDNLGTTWEDWLAFAGIEMPPIGDRQHAHGLHFNHSHLALQAAEQGAGIVLASLPLVADALASKKLVAPFEQQLETGFGYHLVQSLDADQQRRSRTLVEWLMVHGDGK
jgi:LysR family glycine cleavage system transcriptional activator